MLVISSDRFQVRVLSKVLGEAGYDVHLAGAAREGFARAKELLPDCIVCDTKLPDVDGFWVARRVRTEPGRLKRTPFLFLSGAGDAAGRVEGLSVGGDAQLAKPFRNEELVAQVGALIEMARRLAEKQDSYLSQPPSTRRIPAFRGDLAELSIATLLGMLELERRTGKLKLRTDGRQNAELQLIEGMLMRASLAGQERSPVEVLREVLGWKKGRFWFRSEGAPPGEKAARSSIGALLLEAIRLEDESKG